MHFTLFQSVLGVHFIAISRNLLLALSFVYPLLVGAAKHSHICIYAISNLQQICIFRILYAFSHLQQICSILVPTTVLWTFLAICSWLNCTFWCRVHFLGKNSLLATSFEVFMLIVSEKNSPVSVLVLFWYQK